jgi:hypothetical protein
VREDRFRQRRPIKRHDHFLERGLATRLTLTAFFG